MSHPWPHMICVLYHRAVPHLYDRPVSRRRDQDYSLIGGRVTGYARSFLSAQRGSMTASFYMPTLEQAE
jgi:hypothetical protein